MRLHSLTNTQLRNRTLKLAARLKQFQENVDAGRNALLDKTLPGWSDESRQAGFRQTTSLLQRQHRDAQSDFRARFLSEAAALERELARRLGTPARQEDEELSATLQYYSAADLENAARSLPI